MEYDYLYKIILLGDSGSGKTSFMDKYLDNLSPNNTEPTIGVDFRLTNTTTRNGNKVKIYIWDTAGQITFRSIITGYYKDIASAIIFFDVTNRESFNNISKWLRELSEHSISNIRQPIILVGTKIDLPEFNRQVTKLEARDFALENNLEYIELSCFDKEKVEYTMDKLVDLTTKHYIGGRINSNGVKISHKVESISNGSTRNICGTNDTMLDCCCLS